MSTTTPVSGTPYRLRLPRYRRRTSGRLPSAASLISLVPPCLTLHGLQKRLHDRRTATASRGSPCGRTRSAVLVGGAFFNLGGGAVRIRLICAVGCRALSCRSTVVRQAQHDAVEGLARVSMARAVRVWRAGAGLMAVICHVFTHLTGQVIFRIVRKQGIARRGCAYSRDNASLVEAAGKADNSLDIRIGAAAIFRPARA
jgi:hypothetical protein